MRPSGTLHRTPRSLRGTACCFERWRGVATTASRSGARLAALRVGVVMESVSRQGGGVQESARMEARNLVRLGARVSVYGLADQDSRADASNWEPLQPRTFQRGWPRAFGYA